MPYVPVPIRPLPEPKKPDPLTQFNDWAPAPGATGSGSPLDPVPGMDSPPAIPSDSSGHAAVKVNTAAMRSFAANMIQMMKNVETVRDLIDPSKLQVPAGAFSQAYQLRTNVLGSSTTAAGDGTVSGAMPVVSGTFHFLQGADDALAKLKTNMEGIAALYEKTEDLNKEQTAQLATLMSDTASTLGTVSTGTPLTPPTPVVPGLTV